MWSIVKNSVQNSCQNVFFRMHSLTDLVLRLVLQIQFILKKLTFYTSCEIPHWHFLLYLFLCTLKSVTCSEFNALRSVTKGGNVCLQETFLVSLLWWLWMLWANGKNQIFWCSTKLFQQLLYCSTSNDFGQIIWVDLELMIRQDFCCGPCHCQIFC